MIQSKKISLYKTLTWRIIATLTTFAISWAITGSVLLGAGIAGVEFWVKMVVYYYHERAWVKIYNKLEN